MGRPQYIQQEKLSTASIQGSKEKPTAHSIAAIANVAADILAYPAETLIQEICRSAGVAESQVLFVYAGIPCETYSITGRT